MNGKTSSPPALHMGGPEAPQAGPPARLAAPGDSFLEVAAPMAAPGNTLAGLWRVLGRHKTILLMLSVAGAAGGLLFAIMQTPVYRATASLEVQGLNGAFLNLAAVNPIRTGGGAPSPWSESSSSSSATTASCSITCSTRVD